MIPDEEKVFWDHAPMDTDSNLKAIRILICGNAGVGKSTLLNKVFGLPLMRYAWLIPSINLKLIPQDTRIGGGSRSPRN